MLATEARRHATATRTRLSLFSVGLPVVVLLAAGLRLWSIDFGLPLVTHPDEPLIYDAADRMISGWEKANKSRTPGRVSIRKNCLDWIRHNPMKMVLVERGSSARWRAWLAAYR